MRANSKRLNIFGRVFFVNWSTDYSLKYSWPTSVCLVWVTWWYHQTVISVRIEIKHSLCVCARVYGRGFPVAVQSGHVPTSCRAYTSLCESTSRTYLHEKKLVKEFGQAPVTEWLNCRGGVLFRKLSPWHTHFAWSACCTHLCSTSTNTSKRHCM